MFERINNIYKITFLSLICVLFFTMTQTVYALNIDDTHKYAWGENVGWINFGTAEGNILVTDTKLTGYAWGENIGWVSLSCENTDSCGTVNFGVKNDGDGNLSGYAWGENIGWVSFSSDDHSVQIDEQGIFSGYAWGENIGWISFNCANTDSCGTVNFSVKTSWKKTSAGDTVSVPSINVEADRTSRSGSRRRTPPTTQTPSTTTPLTTIVNQYRTLLTQLQALGIELPQNVQDILSQTPTTPTPDTTLPVRDLQNGDTGPDVTQLQQLLIAQGYPIPAGATGYFGTQTQAALVAYQQTNNITPAAGYFGLLTRAQMKAQGLVGLWW